MQFAQRLGLAVDTHHLLPAGVRHAGENARLGRCRMMLQPLYTADGNFLLVEAFQQQRAGLVVADHADRKNVDAQRGEVHDGVGAASGNDRALAMLQDQHWGLARNAGDLAEDELVGDQVGQDGDGNFAEGTHDFLPALDVFQGACSFVW